MANYSITNANGINASVNGNNLTVSITSENYDKTITFSRTKTARDVHIIYGAGSDQKVIYMATRSDPTPSFKLNFDLMYADIEENKTPKQAIRHKAMPHLMEQLLRLKIQTETHLKLLQQMDQK